MLGKMLRWAEGDGKEAQNEADVWNLDTSYMVRKKLYLE